MRLITRDDFDGLVCAALLKEVGVVDRFLFVHPKKVQDGLVDISPDDVLANVPYDPRCGMWFDHHTSELERSRIFLNYRETGRTFDGVARPAKSCARVIYDHYGGSWTYGWFSENGLMDAVDKSDTADFNIEDIMEPKGWTLLSFILDPRTGLGTIKNFRMNHADFVLKMIDWLRTKSIKEILLRPEVRERTDRYFKEEKEYETMIRKACRISENVLVIDLKEKGHDLVGNRFVQYALFPRQNVSIRIFPNPDEEDSVILAVGHSIVNRTCKTDVGSLMLKYGGGGHRNVGSTTASLSLAAGYFREILDTLKKNG